MYVIVLFCDAQLKANKGSKVCKVILVTPDLLGDQDNRDRQVQLVAKEFKVLVVRLVILETQDYPEV